MTLRLLPFLGALLLAGAAAAQTAPAVPPPTTPPAQFEIVSIKEFPPNALSPFGAGLFWIGLQDPSEWRARNQPLLFIVISAYGIGQYERSLVVGLPRWAYLATNLFDIEARVPPHTRTAQIPLMVQAMLADRFQLKAHWEARPMPAIAVTVAPGGPKMQRDTACEDPGRPLARDLSPLVSGESPAAWTASKNPGGCGSWIRYLDNGVLVNVFHGFTVQQFANTISDTGVYPPLVDRTQLAGVYDFTIRVPWTDSTGFTLEQRADLRVQMLHATEQAYRKQLGLNIDYSKRMKLPVPVLVIDHVEKPTAN